MSYRYKVIYNVCTPDHVLSERNVFKYEDKQETIFRKSVSRMHKALLNHVMAIDIEQQGLEPVITDANVTSSDPDREPYTYFVYWVAGKKQGHYFSLPRGGMSCNFLDIKKQEEIIKDRLVAFDIIEPSEKVEIKKLKRLFQTKCRFFSAFKDWLRFVVKK